MNRLQKWLIPILLVSTHFLVIGFQGCSSSSGGGGGSSPNESPSGTTSRPFKMGFSPWPWDATLAAVDDTWSKITANGDIVSFHIEEGVPWNESLNNTAFPQSYQDMINGNLARTPAGAAKLLQVNALNIGRNGLAPFRGQNVNEALTAPWNAYALNDANVKAAYANYVQRMINWVNPKWVLVGIESNLFMRNSKSHWAEYVDLICSTTSTLKSRGVTQPLYVSFFSVPFFPQWSSEDNLTDQKKALADLNSCVDGFAISLHPFISGLLAEQFPSDYLSTLFSYSTKWVGISESSYPAQSFVASGLTFNGTPAKQDDFLQKMFTASESQKLKFVIWYAVRDYDQLWNGALAQDPLALLWRDTGLYDENGAARTALNRWQTEFAKSYQP